MSIGENIRRFRKEMKDENGRTFTQEKLAEKLGVSFQAVSSWERDEYLPETANLLKLAEVFDVPASAILEDKRGTFKTKETIYNWEHMKTYVKTTASALGMHNAYRAVDYAVEAHEGQKRKKSEIPYIYHPLNMACHALSMGIREDAVIAAIMLHDVVEDCGKTLDDLPVGDEAKELVRLMTKDKSKDNGQNLITNIIDDPLLQERFDLLLQSVLKDLLPVLRTPHNVILKQIHVTTTMCNI